jgi:hypothetical protein
VGEFKLVALGLFGTAMGFLLLGPSPLFAWLGYSVSHGMQVRSALPSQHHVALWQHY